jgi:hypothetical protein
MARMKTAQALTIAAGFAVAAAGAACDRAGDREGRGHKGAAINLVGCLQKSESGVNQYVLTQVNSPSQSVGTTGSSPDAQAGVVAQQQMREAKHAYRLDGDNDQLDRLVGKQVSVEGTIADSSNLNRRADEVRKDNKPADLDAGDLAKVDVKTIAAVSDVCSDKR